MHDKEVQVKVFFGGFPSGSCHSPQRSKFMIHDSRKIKSRNFISGKITDILLDEHLADLLPSSTFVLFRFTFVLKMLMKILIIFSPSNIDF